jgi:hypothetical protein
VISRAAPLPRRIPKAPPKKDINTDGRGILLGKTGHCPYLQSDPMQRNSYIQQRKALPLK